MNYTIESPNLIFTGHYSDGVYLKRCLPCPVGSYQHNNRSSSCTQCPDPLTTLEEGSIGCDTCRKGYYLVPSASCESCPKGSTCTEGTTLATIAIDAGYFRFTAESDHIYECPLGKVACPGTPERTLENTSLYRLALCARGYQGALCGTW